jgi:hypothetical protein
MIGMTHRDARGIQAMAATVAQPVSERAASDVLFIVARSCEVLAKNPPREYHEVERIYTAAEVAERWTKVGSGNGDEIATQIGRKVIAQRLAAAQANVATQLLAELDGGTPVL